MPWTPLLGKRLAALSDWRTASHISSDWPQENPMPSPMGLFQDLEMSSEFRGSQYCGWTKSISHRLSGTLDW